MKKFMRVLLFPLMLVLAACAGGVKDLSPEALQAMQAHGALVVDVRTPEEWRETGLIPGSKGLTYFDANGGSDKAGWLRQLGGLQATPDRPVILVCRSGGRSTAVGQMLIDDAGYSKVYQLQGGMRGWRSEHQPLERWCREAC